MGVAVRVTLVPIPTLVTQGPPLHVTVPLPDPDSVIVKEVDGTKVAVTLCAAFMATVQVLALPVHAPPQAERIDPVPGVAVRVMLVPGRKLVLQRRDGGTVVNALVPQLIAAFPVRPLVTVPLPEPVVVTLRG